MLKQHGGQSLIHTQLGSMKIVQDAVHASSHASASWKERLYVCEASAYSLSWISFDWNLRASIGLVPCVMVSRSIVVHWDGAWSASHPWSAVLSAEVGQVRAESALSIAAPRQRALYPILPFSTLP